MTFYQIFIKLLRFNFIGTIIILIIYFFLNDIYGNLNKPIGNKEIIQIPGDLTIKKIDAGYGDDYWILTENNEVIVVFFFRTSER